MKSVPSNLAGKVNLISGNASQIIQHLNLLNYTNLYIDGGKTIQSFLEQDLIDEMIITTVPVLLGSGIPLFGQLNRPLYFNCIASKCYLHGVTQSTFKRQEH
jgi:dihydrofolate reductase